MDRVEGYIKYLTSQGGDREREFLDYATEECESAFEGWLEESSKCDGKTLYRGYRLEDNLAEALVEGAVIGPLNVSSLFHPAFTPDPMRASIYMNEMGSDYGQKFFFELKTGGKYMVDISSHSIYPSEKEYQPTWDARWLITKIRPRGGFTDIYMIEI